MIEVKDEHVMLQQSGERWPTSILHSRELIGFTWMVQSHISGQWLGPFQEWHEVNDCLIKLDGMAFVWERVFIRVGDAWQLKQERVNTGHQWTDPINLIEVSHVPRYGTSALKFIYQDFRSYQDLLNSLTTATVRHHDNRATKPTEEKGE